MARLPVTQEMRGGKPPRQRVWEQIRKQPVGFTQAQLAEFGKVPDGIVKDYVKVLLKAGFIAVVDSEPAGGVCRRNIYSLTRDNGVEAPRLTKKGEIVTQGGVNEAMWGTLRRVLKGKSFNFRELASFASTTSQAVGEETARNYVHALFAARYLECTKEAVRGIKAQPARYRLKSDMESGPLAPMIQRTKTVYDPNWNKVVWIEEIGAQDEAL